MLTPAILNLIAKTLNPTPVIEGFSYQIDILPA